MTRLPNDLRMASLGWLSTLAMSMTLFPATKDNTFIFPAALVSGLLVVLGSGLRALRVPALVVVLAQLVVAAELVVLLFARNQMKLGWLPTRDSLGRLRDLTRSGIDVANEYAAPAPKSLGLTLLFVLGITVIAVLVDFAVSGIRRVPLAGLPLLGLYTAAVAILRDGVPLYLFLPGAAAYIALLMADERERIHHWGRVVPTDHSPLATAPIDTSAVSARGRRISAGALAIAVFVPLVVPVWSGGLFDTGAGKGGSFDGSRYTFNNPMVQVANNLRDEATKDLLFVNGPETDPPEYLRLAVLDLPSSVGWTTTNVDLDTSVAAAADLPNLFGFFGQEGPPSTYLITIPPDFETQWLPVPYNLKSLRLTAPNWRYLPVEQTVVNAKGETTTDLLTFNATAAQAVPDVGRLEEAGSPGPEIINKYADIPRGLPEVVTSTAREVTAEASNDYERAVLLQNFFRDPSRFSYQVVGPTGDGFQSMVNFLDDGRGFCQQFAATMATMARTLGIPSRVVVGFLRPEQRDGGYVFTNKQMHAWPELYFTGMGWVRFEPTIGSGAVEPSWAPANFDPGAGPSLSTSTAPTSAPTSEPNPTTAAPDPNSSGSGGGGNVPSIWWIAGLVVLLFLVSPGIARYAVRRARMNRPVEERAAAESAWSELRDHIRDLRLPWSDSMTPRGRMLAIAPLLGDDVEGRGALTRLAFAVERARFARTPAIEGAPAADAATVMSAIDRGVDRRQRVRARLWPTSLVPTLSLAMRRRRRRSDD